MFNLRAGGHNPLETQDDNYPGKPEENDIVYSRFGHEAFARSSLITLSNCGGTKVRWLVATCSSVISFAILISAMSRKPPICLERTAAIGIIEQCLNREVRMQTRGARLRYKREAFAQTNVA